MKRLCDVPVNVAKRMTTGALVRTLLDYPLAGRIFSSNQSMSAAITNITSELSVVPELFDRPDAGSALVQAYQTHSEAYISDRNNKFAAQTLLTALLTEDRIIDKLTSGESKCLAILALRNVFTERKAAGGFYAGEAIPARLAVKLMLKKDVKVELPGKTFGKENLPTKAATDFVAGHHDFIPEKDFFDLLIDGTVGVAL
jgi:hypothetical protein